MNTIITENDIRFAMSFRLIHLMRKRGLSEYAKSKVMTIVRRKGEEGDIEKIAAVLNITDLLKNAASNLAFIKSLMAEYPRYFRPETPACA